MILVDDVRAHEFLEAALHSDIRTSGSELSIIDVVGEMEYFEAVPASERFTDGNGSKYVNAISDLCAKQRTILSKANTPRLRDYGLINTWLQNLCNAECDKRERHVIHI